MVAEEGHRTESRREMEGLGVEGGGGRSVGSLNGFPASDIKLAVNRVDIKIDIPVSVFSLEI